MNALGVFQQAKEFVNTQARLPQQRAQSAQSQFVMQRDGQNRWLTSFPIWRWLPRILKRYHPAFSNAFAASSHEMPRGSRNLQPSTFTFASVSCHSWMPRS